jgi:hypothetical protein
VAVQVAQEALGARDLLLVVVWLTPSAAAISS